MTPPARKTRRSRGAVRAAGSIRRLAVIGAGAWGTALALVARRASREVAMWAREPEIAAAINRAHVNEAFLPGIELDPAIRASADLGAAVAGADALLLAVPAQHLRAVARHLAHLARGLPAVICAKGIEVGSCKLMSQVVEEVWPRAPLAVLSGPTFALEVAQGLPSAVTLAAADPRLGRALVAALGTPTFRPYLGDDLIGAQVGGAVKNVIAIACGIVEARGLGDNARAALMTRGLAEILRLGAALGARPQTLMGLSGLGDLALTCNGRRSRNLALGMALGKGRTLAEALAGKRSIAEGVASAAAVSDLALALGVDMPIVNAVDAILHHYADIGATIAGLLERVFTSEIR
ncbi:MAG: NAD(P)H-dependent glycerol-3-phosphate dehydrogenase [Pseudomonadota bacterium]